MFQGIDHIAILVEDLETGRNLFEHVYGFNFRRTNSDEHRQAAGADAAFFDAGDVVIELMAPIADATNDGWAARHMDTHGPGFFHIAYTVDDIHEATAKLEEHNIRMLFDEPREGFSGLIMTCDPQDTIMPTQIVEPTGSK